QRAGNDECSRFDAVGDDPVARTMQLLDALYANAMGSRAFNLRAHFAQQRGEVHDLRLARTILENRLALGKSCCHQQVFGSGDGDLLEDDTAALEAFGAGLYVTVLLRDLCSELLQPLDMQVDRTCADGAAAGQ